MWNRRQLLTESAKLAATMAITRTGIAQTVPELKPMHSDRVRIVTTTEQAAWQPGAVYEPAFAWNMLNLNVSADELTRQPDPGSTMLGFGACFNELGWQALQSLTPADRESILRELFHPHEGARFSYCRMPIGANDFSLRAYSYDEVDGDFALQHFSIQPDRATLIPFIHAAQQYRPDLKLWASPWMPPSWMKRNRFYAENTSFAGMPDNGIHPDQIGHEGEDMFVQEPRYFEAYARYFGRFIDAYRAENIPIGMVMPQNEFNSAQNFPSCTWTAEGLTRFLHYLLPEMSQRDVEVFFGTLERGNPALLAPAMHDRDIARRLRGVGVQWAGKNAVPALHREYPALSVIQSEQECGDGTNTWTYTGYCWQLMKHYFRSGARGYMYWNIALHAGGKSTWGWSQNSLVTVDGQAKTFRYTHDYSLMKHLTHFVIPGAHLLETTGTCDDALGFRNRDGTVVLLVRNALAVPQRVQVQLGAQAFAVELPPDSLSTLAVQPA